jgi:hypothetical protein
MDNMVRAIPEKDFVVISKRMEGRYARYEIISIFLKPYLSARVPEKRGTTYEKSRKMLWTIPSSAFEYPRYSMYMPKPIYIQ